MRSFISYLLILSLGSLAAQEGFNVVYTNPYLPGATGCWGHVVHEEGIYMNNYIVAADTTTRAYWLHYNLQGVLQDSLIIPYISGSMGTTPSRYGNVVHEPDGMVINTVDWYPNEMTSDNLDYLTKIDWGGNVLWQYDIGVDTTGYQGERYKGVVKHEEDYLAFGYMTDTIGTLSFSQVRGLLTKVSASGEVLWHRRYDQVLNIRLCEVKENGDILLCGEQDLASASTDGTEALLIMCDSQGQERWRYLFGNNPGDENNDTESQCPTVIMNDGSLVTFVKDEGIEDINNGWGPIWVQRILDQGTTYEVVESFYPPDLYDTEKYIFNAEHLSDDGIALVGLRNQFTAPSAENPEGLWYGIMGYMARFDSDLELLYDRYYGHWNRFDHIQPAYSQLYDITELPDGGFIMSGSDKPAPQAPQPYAAHSWLIRTDSLGCIEPGCQNITGLAEQISGLQGTMSLFPNPVQAGQPLNLSFSPHAGSTMPYTDRNTSILIYDLQGRLVHEEPISASGSNAGFILSLDLPDLASGQYNLHWIDENMRWYDGLQFVVGK